MYRLAIILGIYSYSLLFTGILGLFKPNFIIPVSLLFILAVTFFCFDRKYKFKKTNWTNALLISLIIVGALVNLIGVYGPELSFDALWYHLTIPKLYLTAGKIFYIPGNLLNYSVTPKAIDLMFSLPLLLGIDSGTKLIEFLFGLLTAFNTYKISRKFVDQQLSIISSLIFYSSLVVGWESAAAYVDLGWAFFETCSLFLFLNWIEKRSIKNLIYLGILSGLTVCTKIVGINSLIIYSILIFAAQFNPKIKNIKAVANVALYLSVSILTLSPWLIFAYVNTGNFFYPLFSNVLKIDSSISIFNLTKLLFNPSDPINPIYLITLPLIFFVYKKFGRGERIILYYCLLSIALWFVFSFIGGSRFLLPYLCAFSVLVVLIINRLNNAKINKIILFLIILFSFVSIAYRAAANLKVVPVVLGKESKQEYLQRNLNFSFGDFYDVDNFFAEEIKKEDKVLLYGFHNLYYVDFPYIDSSWVKAEDKFNYVATQKTDLPKRFSNLKMVYENSTTHVKLYKSNAWLSY